MPARIRLTFLGLTFAFFAIAAVPLYQEFTRPSDIWWTPHAMLVPLAESADRVEIYARGTPLAELVKAGQLRIGDDRGASVVAAGDVGLRFNNRDRLRAERFPLLVVNAAACGAIALLFLLVLTGRLAYRGEKGQAGM